MADTTSTVVTRKLSPHPPATSTIARQWRRRRLLDGTYLGEPKAPRTIHDDGRLQDLIAHRRMIHVPRHCN